jgi:hypothetical protein
MYLATGPSGAVDSSSSTSLSPTGKKSRDHLLGLDRFRTFEGQPQNIRPEVLALVDAVDGDTEMVNFENLHGPSF